MHYQGYQSNNKQPAGPLILHISESYFLKFFPHRGRGIPPPHPPLLARYARPRARFTRIMRPPPPLSKLLQSLCTQHSSLSEITHEQYQRIWGSTQNLFVRDFLETI